MSSDWELMPLGEICEIKQGRYLSPQEMESSPTEESQVPVVGGNGILGYTTYSTYDFGVPLVTCRGSRCGLMQWAEPPTWVSNNAMAVSLKDGNHDNYFLYALLRTLDFDDVISGSAQPQITVSSLSRKMVSTPPGEIRHFIGKLARLIESKIELNAQTSSTLESIAQTLFRSWFVDFDPVRAKMSGEKPVGMDDATAALFPDSMEESELGDIPAGWKVRELPELAEIQYGAPFASKLFNSEGEGTPLLRIRDLKAQAPSTWTTETHPKGFIAEAGDLLIGMDGEFNPTLWLGENSYVNQRVCRVLPGNNVAKFFLYFSLIPVMRRIERGSTGSTVIHLGKSDLDAIKLLSPPVELLDLYRQVVSPMLSQMVSLKSQNRALETMRDALLPRLISGELQVPEDLVA